MATQTDLFNEPHIQIPGNKTLENEVNRLLYEIQRNPRLLDGDDMGDIDYRLWFTGMNLSEFFDAHAVELIKKCILKAPPFETTSRARRFLLQKDLIRVSSKAVKAATQFEARISSSFRK